MPRTIEKRLWTKHVNSITQQMDRRRRLQQEEVTREERIQREEGQMVEEGMGRLNAANNNHTISIMESIVMKGKSTKKELLKVMQLQCKKI